MKVDYKDRLELIITGDYHPTEKLTDFLNNGNGPYKVFGPLINIINEVDFAITHLEIPATESEVKIAKGGLYGKTEKKCIDLLANAGFNLCTFASNHTNDYGQKGVEDTLKYCKENKLSVVGAGMNSYEARLPFISEINNIKFAILNYAETEFNISDENSAGANPIDLINIYNDINSLKELVDHIIVIFHAGQDFIFHPSPRLVRVYRYIATLGVSAILSHHSHFISSHEIYNNVPISYGLGHLVYYYNENDDFTRLFNVAKIKLTKTKCEVEYLPFYFDARNSQIINLSNHQLAIFIKKQKELNEAIKDEAINYKNWFLEISKEDTIRNLSLLLGYPQILFRIFKKLGILKIYEKLVLLNKRKFLPIWNISKCPRHLQSINFIFENFLFKNKKI